jgi:hypothetical protein
MMKKCLNRRLFVLFIFLSACACAFAQTRMVQYSRDFEFKEGIYLTVFNFKNNSPIIRSKISFNSNKNDKDFFNYVLARNILTYTDSAGKEEHIQTEKVWGYFSNGTLYINYGTGFNRVAVIGSLCHFVAVMPTRIGMNDPFTPFNPYQPYGSMQPRYVYATNQYVLDFESGSVFEFDVTHMEVLLQRDVALYNEFMALKKKQKRDSIFLYLRKYNEKHPVYFPE